MHSVGTTLRAAREKKGFSLEEINARTRINSRNLNAIERDEVSDISSPFFYRSFVKQYAQEVGLDFLALAPAVEALAGNMRQPDLPGQGEHQPVRVAPIQARPKRDYSWIVPTAVFLGMVVIGSGGFAAWKFYTPLPRNTSAASLVSQQSIANTPAPNAGASKPLPDTSLSAAVPGNPGVNPMPKATPETAPADDRIHLELAAIEPTWLSVSADGKPAYTGILEPAEVKVLEGQQSARLRTGNAGGVTITFNGKAIGAIGPRGTTRTVIFTKTGFEVEKTTDEARLIPASHIGG